MLKQNIKIISIFMHDLDHANKWLQKIGFQR